MRALTLSVVLFSVAATAQDAPVEVFTDRGDFFMRAGSKAGLAVGASVTIFGDQIGGTDARRRIGTAVVMEVWDGLARIKLDAAASGDGTAKKFAALEGAGAKKPAAAAKGAEAKGAPAAEGAKDSLRGHATFKGVGPWKLLGLTNKNTFDWTSCVLRLADKRSYRLGRLRRGDRESIANSNFTYSGPEIDVPLNWVDVKCAEGWAKINFTND